MSLSTLQAALVLRFESITDLRFLPAMPQSLSPPTGFIGPITRLPARTFDGASTTTAEVFICLGAAELARSVAELDEYADSDGAKSIELAIDNDPTLEDEGDILLTQAQSPVSVEVGGVPFLAAQFTIEIYH